MSGEAAGATAPGARPFLRDGGQNPEHQGGRQGVTKELQQDPAGLGLGSPSSGLLLFHALGLNLTPSASSAWTWNEVSRLSRAGEDPGSRWGPDTPGRGGAVAGFPELSHFSKLMGLPCSVF